VLTVDRMTENNANKLHHFNGFVILGIWYIVAWRECDSGDAGGTTPMDNGERNCQNLVIWCGWIPVRTPFRTWSSQLFAWLCLSGHPGLFHGPNYWTVVWHGTPSPCRISNQE